MYRTALGYDLHRLKSPSAKGIICAGVHIDCGLEIEAAHSDGDVVFHALTDALLSTVGTDIGTAFPNDDPANKNRDSRDFLEYAFSRLQYGIVNIDIVIICDKPKISPHAQTMIKKISEILGTPLDSISIRGKTTENTSPNTIQAYANVLFKKI